jgi:hypothetical protein
VFASSRATEVVVVDARDRRDTRLSTWMAPCRILTIWAIRILTLWEAPLFFFPRPLCQSSGRFNDMYSKSMVTGVGFCAVMGRSASLHNLTATAYGALQRRSCCRAVGLSNTYTKRHFFDPT